MDMFLNCFEVMSGVFSMQVHILDHRKPISVAVQVLYLIFTSNCLLGPDSGITNKQKLKGCIVFVQSPKSRVVAIARQFNT